MLGRGIAAFGARCALFRSPRNALSSFVTAGNSQTTKNPRVSSPISRHIPPETSCLQWNGLTKRMYSQKKEESSDSINKRIEGMVKNNKVVVFMKGVPDQPMCGFSNAVVQVLRMHGVEGYDSHNVLEDEDIRQGIKTYSDWPTIPQVYFDGEFVGGCDILLQMHQNGDLIEELGKLGIKSALAK